MNAKILIRRKSIFPTHDTEYTQGLELGHEPAAFAAAEDLYEPIEKSVAKRLPWLIILLGLGLVVSGVVGIFGNVGTQSLAVTIRVLMDESVSRSQKLQLILKETRVGFLNGLILGGLSFFFIGLYLMLLKGQTPLFSFAISFCTGVALLTAMLLSSLSGTIIPLLFKNAALIRLSHPGRLSQPSTICSQL